MATTSRTKDSVLGKERRGTSPSSSLTGNNQRSSRRSTTEKHIPNYLKPTISSRHETLKLSKKSSTEDSQKSLRRRSFDKPPSSSPRGQKALLSPPRRYRSAGAPPAPTVPRERNLTVRSSSFSGKSVVLQKPVLDNRISKTPKAVKSQSFFSKTVKKRSNVSPNRKECNASTSSKASSNDSSETVDQETKPEEKEMVKIESQSEVNSENGEQVLDAADVINNGEAEKMNNPIDISTCSEDQVGENEETDTQQDESTEKLNKEEVCDNNPEEIIEEEAKAAHDEVEDNKNENEETEEEKKIEENTGSEEFKAEELGQELEGDGEEEKQDFQAVSKIQQGNKKKESPTAYNDVIEETASKLMEKRKNKVRALVGAFETVIDYQSAGSK